MPLLEVQVEVLQGSRRGAAACQGADGGWPAGNCNLSAELCCILRACQAHNHTPTLPNTQPPTHKGPHLIIKLTPFSHSSA